MKIGEWMMVQVIAEGRRSLSAFSEAESGRLDATVEQWTNMED